MASLLCTDAHVLFLDCRTLATEQVPFDPAAAGLAVLGVDSRSPHQLTDGAYAERRRSCEQAARTLGVPALRDATEADLDRLDGELLRSGRIREIGPLMTASHASMRDDFEITVAQVDVAVEAALAAGAYGARMTGGGFGGCVLALIDADRADETSAAAERAYERRGFTAPTAWSATPGPGAARVS